MKHLARINLEISHCHRISSKYKTLHVVEFLSYSKCKCDANAAVINERSPMHNVSISLALNTAYVAVKHQRYIIAMK